MTIEELGQQVKSKHPEYANYPDTVVGNRVLVKYPSYQNQIGPGVKATRDQIEPGVMGETDPVEQKLVENAATAAAGYTLPGAVETVAAIPGKIKTALGESTVPLLKALGKSPKELGPEFAAGNEAAGISDQLPVQRGSMARFPQPERIVPTKQPTPIAKAETLPSVPPVSYPKDPASFINFAQARIKAFGNRLSPQELNDYKAVIDDMMGTGKVASKTPQGAVASQLRTDATGLHTDAIPGREALNKTYGLSKTLHPDIVQGVKDFARDHGIEALVGALGLKSLLSRKN